MSNSFISAFSREIYTKDAPVGVRFMTGRQVIDEGLIDGRLVCRYRLCSGQICPDMHLSETYYKQIVNDITIQCFSLSVDGINLENWEYEGFCEIEDTSWFRGDAKVFALSIINQEHFIRVKVKTRLDGSDITIRWLEIENLSDKAIGIDYVMPLSGRIWDHFTGFWCTTIFSEILPEGRNPYEVAYCHNTEWGKEGDFFFDSIKSGEPISFGSIRGKSGWNRPSLWLRDIMTGETFVCELGYSGNWSANISYTEIPLSEKEKQYRLSAEIGLTVPSGEVLRVLEPGEKLETPAVHFGVFRDSDDKIVQTFHAHVRNTVLPLLPEGVPLTEIEANHRGYLCDRESHEGIINDIDTAASVGTELYVIDAGWYGNEPNTWVQNTGDWFSGSWLKYGLEPIVEHVHEKGMRFGLWAEIEAIGNNTNLLKEHPDWRMFRYNEPCAGGRALDLSNPVVEKWIASEVCRLIEQYKLEMFRIDHNHDIGLGGTKENHGYTENTLWRYYDALYRIFRNVSKKYPSVVLQNCAGGGGRMDLGILRCFHNTETSDWMRMPRGMKVFSGTTMFLPPEILLRTFGTEVPDINMESDIETQLRVAIMSRPIYRGISPSIAELSPYLLEKMSYYSKFYKEFMRPIMKDCKVFHHTPYLKVMTPYPWLVMEYASADKTASVTCVYSMSVDCSADGYEYLFKARGLNRSLNYKVTFENLKESIIMSGFDIMNNGLMVYIGHQMSSELLTFKAV